MKESSFLISGLVRNCEKGLECNIKSLINAFSEAKKLRLLIIESDSSDNSIDILNHLTSKYEDFCYISLGHLRCQYPKRSERLAYCRNTYLKRIRESESYFDVDYVVVADLDNINHKLTGAAVRSCWNRDDWDVCTANQSGPYYDIWALRHPLWSPNDCLKYATFLQNIGISRFQSTVSSVYSRMVEIPAHSEWIEVESAFGGLAIYRKEVLLSAHYVGLTESGEEICEHVSLHEQIRAKGGRIFINPAMINVGVSEHARYATPIGLIRFWMRCQSFSAANSIGLLPHLKRIRMFVESLLS